MTNYAVALQLNGLLYHTHGELAVMELSWLHSMKSLLNKVMPDAWERASAGLR